LPTPSWPNYTKELEDNPELEDLTLLNSNKELKEEPNNNNNPDNKDLLLMMLIEQIFD